MKRILTVAALIIIRAAPGAAATSMPDDDAWKQSLTPEVQACENDPNNGGTFQQAICYRDELARQDARLNTVWQQLPEGRRARLRAKERQWISERDKDCKDVADGYINSTAAYMFNTCMVEETINRINWIEQSAPHPR
jgi:uncharacterized protein YecT (DUF1311 family)